MAKLREVTYRFVGRVPSPLEDGIVYVSIEFGTVIHKCCCGCGDKVVTPLTPVDWAIMYDGLAISLYPSIGRWDALCKSHYWIRNNRVVWAEAWSKGEISTLKHREEELRDTFFGLVHARPHQDLRIDKAIQETTTGIAKSEKELNRPERLVSLDDEGGKPNKGCLMLLGLFLLSCAFLVLANL